MLGKVGGAKDIIVTALAPVHPLALTVADTMLAVVKKQHLVTAAIDEFFEPVELPPVPPASVDRDKPNALDRLPTKVKEDARGES